MTDIIIDSIITDVPFGNFTIEGIFLETSEFAVAVPQIAKLFPYFQKNQDYQNQASKYLKRLMGEGFKTSKTKTEFNRNVTLAVTLIDFERLLLKLYKIGDPVAESMVDSLVGLSLNQLFCDAFEQMFDKEDRQAYLSDRQNTKTGYHIFKFEVDGYISDHPELSEKRRKWLMVNCMDDMNRLLFGKRSYQIKEELGFDPVVDAVLIRDYFNSEALKRIDNVQTLAGAKIRNRGILPTDAMLEAIADLSFPVMRDYLSAKGRERVQELKSKAA